MSYRITGYVKFDLPYGEHRIFSEASADNILKFAPCRAEVFIEQVLTLFCMEQALRTARAKYTGSYFFACDSPG